MSNELHDLLDRGAAAPSSDVDVDALVRTARGRRHRRVGVLAAAVVVLVAVVGGAVALAQPSSTVSIPTRPATQRSVSVPDGWRTVENRDQRISLAIPPEWTKVDSSPFELLTVGTEDFRHAAPIAPCPSESSQIPPVQGTWVSLSEFPDPPDHSNPRIVMIPGIPNIDVAVSDRPEDLRTAPSSDGACGPSSYAVTAFRDSGRIIVALIVTTDGSPLDLAYQVLNTLQVGEADTSTPTTPTTAVTVPPTTVVTTPTTSVQTAPVSASGDEAEIRAVFLAWLDAQDRNAMVGIVEDYASIESTHLEGMHQHTAADLATYSGRIDSVTLIDGTHADVRYTVLHGGRADFSMMPGQAVKIDGKWMVSRETVCNLLKYGGLTCPPRA